MQRKLIIVFAVIIAGILIAITFPFFRTQARTPGLATQTLPDGTQIIVQAVTYGTNHVFARGSAFLARLKVLLPVGFHKWLGNQITIGTATTDPTAVIWFSAFDPTTERYKYISPDSFEIVDDHGCVTRISQFAGGASDPAFSVQRAYADVFPRRQKTFTFRASFSGFPPLELKVPNQFQMSSTQEWTPEPLPATRTVGTTNFTLSRIRGHFTEGRHWFDAPLKIEIDGKDRTSWFNSWPIYRDATGNRSHALCPYEPTWKVEYEVRHSHEAPFPEDQIVRISDLTFPKSGEVSHFRETRTLGVISVQFIGLCGPGDYKFSNGVCIASAPYEGSIHGESFSSSSSSGPPPRVEFAFRRSKASLLVTINGLERSDDLLLRGRDDSGKPFRISFNGSADRTYRYELHAPTNATRFALELIPQKPVRVEYTVAPPRPPK